MANTGYCGCGCGAKTRIAPRTITRKGWVRGEPIKYLAGHTNKTTPSGYVVDDETGCWNWVQKKTRAGYGMTNQGGRSQTAHRWVYRQYKGEIPPGLDLDHLCCNKGCVNPDHLEPVTRKENVRRGPHIRISQQEVEDIRLLFTFSRLPSVRAFAIAMSRVYGISFQHVDGILRGKTRV